MSGSKQIKLGAFLSYVSIAMNIIAGLLYTPWMVDKIGKSQYGLFTLANSLITLFLIDFGLSAATARYLSKYTAEGKTEDAEKFLGAVYKLYLIVNAVILAILAVLYFFLDLIYVKLSPVELEQFKVVYVISALFSVINFPFVTFNGILTAYEKFIPMKAADVLYRLLNIAFTVIALLLGYGLYALVTVHAVVALLAALYKFIVIKRTIPLKVNFKSPDKKIFQEIFGFSIWVTVSALAQRLVFTITPTILGVVSSTAAIAVFGVVTTIEGYTYTITTAINGIYMPKISRILTVNETKETLHPLFFNVGKFQYVLNGLVIAGFAVVGHTFILFWMGNDYLEAYAGILLVIIPGIFYNSLQIANTTMVVIKRVKLTALVNAATGMINILLSFPLSKLFGVVGACVSICVAYMVRAIILNLIYHRTLPVNIPEFIKKCYIKMSLPVILTILVGIFLNLLASDTGWMVLLLKSAIVVNIYLLFVYLIGLNKNERDRIIRFVRTELLRIKPEL